MDQLIVVELKVCIDFFYGTVDAEVIKKCISAGIHVETSDDNIEFSCVTMRRYVASLCVESCHSLVVFASGYGHILRCANVITIIVAY